MPVGMMTVMRPDHLPRVGSLERQRNLLQVRIDLVLHHRADEKTLVADAVGELLDKRHRLRIVVATRENLEDQMRRLDRRSNLRFGVRRVARRQIAPQNERDLRLDARRRTGFR